jgi:hypothetical protein
MKTVNKRLIISAGALIIAEVAMAAAPKSSIDTDDKDTRVANVFVTSPSGDTATYTCDYAWQITFSNGGETTDSCEVKVPPGSTKLAVCTKKYDRRISVVHLLQANCKPSPP